ncbi:MAG: tetratricopeptide repeat protein [Dermabacter sp.]|nr:tetratricopeptide repeat protein [Dermabacter sp.]
MTLVHTNDTLSPEAPTPHAPGSSGHASWRIDPDTLRPRIIDLAAFREEFDGDPAGPILEALWRGDPDRAEELLLHLLGGAAPSTRFAAILADIHRDQGRTDLSVTEYRDILERTRGTQFEALTLHMLGKSLFAGGRFEEAQHLFTRAFELCVLEGASPEFMEASMTSIRRTRDALRAAHAPRPAA